MSVGYMRQARLRPSACSGKKSKPEANGGELFHYASANIGNQCRWDIFVSICDKTYHVCHIVPT